jgi:hypothetical protein
MRKEYVPISPRATRASLRDGRETVGWWIVSKNTVVRRDDRRFSKGKFFDWFFEICMTEDGVWLVIGKGEK